MNKVPLTDLYIPQLLPNKHLFLHERNKMDQIHSRLSSVKYRLYGHEENLRWCEKWNRILGMLQISLSSVIAAMSFNGIFEGREDIAIANFILGVILATVTSVLNFLKFPNQIDSHRQAIQRYSTLYQEIEIFTLIDPSSKSQDEIFSFLREISKKYHEIKTGSPLIREKIYQRKKKTILEHLQNIIRV